MRTNQKRQNFVDSFFMVFFFKSLPLPAVTKENISERIQIYWKKAKFSVFSNTLWIFEDLCVDFFFVFVLNFIFKKGSFLVDWFKNLS